MPSTRTYLFLMMICVALLVILNKTSPREAKKDVGKEKQIENVVWVSENNIFSAVDGAIEGEGFFLEYDQGKKIFIFNGDFTRNPHDIANLQRKVKAIQRGAGKMSFSGEIHKEIFVSSKSALGKEHQLLASGEYQDLAKEVRRVGQKIMVDLVAMDQVKTSQSALRIASRGIDSIGSLAMTTGGSVYFFPVNFKDKVPLNIWVSTQENNGLDRLRKFSEEIKKELEKGFVIIAKDAIFVDKIFAVTVDSHDTPPSGWYGLSVSIDNVSLEK